MQVTYEAYGPGGTGFVMECLTDNLNRSASEVRAAVTKSGGKMADPGSVLFNFQRQGLVYVSAAADEDTVRQYRRHKMICSYIIFMIMEILSIVNQITVRVY